MLIKSKQTQFHNRITSEQVWYRLFRYTHGEYYGENQIGLGRGYFIDLYVGTLPGLLESLEKSQNRSPALDLKLAQLRFHLRWIEPVIRLPFLLLLPRLRARLSAMRRSVQIKQTSRRIHPEHSTDNLCNSHAETSAKLLGDSHSICRA